jgi:hypothetical protein
MMHLLCTVAVRALIILYLGAVLLFLIGSFGLFGYDRDPLSGIFLVPLGFPWNRLLDWFPEPLWPWLAAAAPIITIGLLRFLCSRLHKPGAV